MRTAALALAFVVLGGCASAGPEARTSASSTTTRAGSRAERVDPRSERVVAALVPLVHVKGEPDARHELAERMLRYHVPGVSVAVVDGGRIAWARGFGVVERGKTMPITPRTMFQAASISKPIAATGMMRLAEQGKVSLDEDVNRYLRSWKVPENEFTQTEKVTLRRLASHTAGTNLHGFKAYHEGEPLPTVPQILEGQKPANTPPIRVVAVPGSTVQYSGGGVMIEQLAMMDVTGKPFAPLMKELVLDPAGMRDSTFEEPLSAELAARASTAHDTRGAVVPGRFLVSPELAAAGLWSTPSDLLAWAIAVDDAAAGRASSAGLLSQSWAQAMLTPQMGPLGIGPVVRGEGRARRFGHPGWNHGFHSELIYFPELRQGACVMVNGHGGRPLLREILYAISAEYGWPAYTPDTVERIAMGAKEREAFVGTYAVDTDGVTIEARVRAEGDELYLDADVLGVSSRMLFTSQTAFVVEDSADQFGVKRGDDGSVTAIVFGDSVLVRQKS